MKRKWDPNDCKCICHADAKFVEKKNIENLKAFLKHVDINTRTFAPPLETFVGKIMTIAMHRIRDENWAKNADASKALQLLKPLYDIHYLHIPLHEIDKFFSSRETKQNQAYALALNRMMELLHPSWAQSGGVTVQTEDGSNPSVRWIGESIQLLDVKSVADARGVLMAAQKEWRGPDGTTFESEWDKCSRSIPLHLELLQRPVIKRFMYYYNEAAVSLFGRE